MSHRTDHLEATGPLTKILNKLRYKEIYRQGLGIILLMVFAYFAMPAQPWAAIGIIMVVIGGLIRFWAAGMVIKNKILATSGPYAWARHPLYVGNILIMFGMVVICLNWWIFLTTVLFFWFFYPPTIQYEDRKLAKLFGDEWSKWASRVPALLPRFSPYPNASDDSWELKRAVGRNGELYILLWVAASVVVALYF